MSHYSWTIESRVLEKKLNGEKKKQLLTKRMIFGFISEIKDLNISIS